CMPPAGPTDRRNVLVAASGVVLLFGLTDFLILHRLSPACAAVRLAWAGVTLGAALALGTRRERAWLYAASVGAGAAFAALVALTGGVQSPMFHWILAVPLTVAVVIQDAPGAI